MSRIEELKNELAVAVRASDEYKEYKFLADYINRYPDLKRQVDELRRENFYYQVSDDIEDPIGATAQLDERFADIRRQPMVNRYLSAEMCLCRMVQDICMSVVGAIDFEVDFLN